MSPEQELAREPKANDLAPAAMAGGAEEESKTRFTSKGTIPPPLLGNEPTTGAKKSASDAAFGSPVDPAVWSKQQADALVTARARIHLGQLGLGLDDGYSTLLFARAKDIMVAYEERWLMAKTQFEGGVQRHLDVAAKRRETGNFLMGVALGNLPQTKALKALNKILEVKAQIEGGIDALNIEKSGFGSGKRPAPGAATDPGPAQAKAPDGTKVQWLPLVDQLLASKKAFGASVEKVTTLEHEYDDLIEMLRAGEVSPDSKTAQRAEALAGYRLPAAPNAFIEAHDFMSDVESALGDKMVPDIEREMAMQWIAELAPTQLDALDDVNGYLISIGVVGPRSSKGLNIDGGKTLFDNEEKLLWHKARVRAEMQELVGQHAEWLGGRRVGDTLHGSVRINGNVYAAKAKAAATDKCYVDQAFVSEHAGGSVVIQKSQHQQMGIPQMTSNEIGGSVPVNYLEQLRLGQFELVVGPDGGNWETDGAQVKRG